jgi:hypothetical protein
LKFTRVVFSYYYERNPKENAMRLNLKITALTTLPLLLASPALASASASAAAPPRHLSVGDIFGAAALPVQLIILLLLATIVAAPVLLALGRASKLGVLAKGAPLLAVAACLFTLLAGAVGIANSPVVPSLTVLAPGLAESLFLLVLGALATFSAVVCRELAKPRGLA